MTGRKKGECYFGFPCHETCGPFGQQNRFTASCLVTLLVAISACNPKHSTGYRHSDLSHQPQTTGQQRLIHVHPGDDIQSAIDRAADLDASGVVVHPGIYRPSSHRQSFIWFNEAHDGLEIIADGDVTLTASNPAICNKTDPGYPAVVNHVVYFGDGVTDATKFRGFRITGANDYVTTGGPIIEAKPRDHLPRTPHFYFGGGGIKVYGRAYPVLEDLEIFDNYSSPSGAGISIEQLGRTEKPVTIRSCVFCNNRTPMAGSALHLVGDKLESSSNVLVENCLFVNNLSNSDLDDRCRKLTSWLPEAGHGAISVSSFSKATFLNCTVTGNRNGIDDRSRKTFFEACVLWNNNSKGGWAKANRYETATTNGKSFQGCFVGGSGVAAQLSELDPQQNMLDAPNPDFDEEFVPQNPIYADAGFRPISESSYGEIATDTDDHIPNTEIPLTIRALGQDYNWYFSYSGKDGVLGTEDDLCTRRHLYVPSGRPIELLLESKDYLYSLKLPKQGANEIAIPGMVHRISFNEPTAGSYPLSGDQFCGYIHPNLIGRIIVQPEARFAKSIANNHVTKKF